MSQRWLLHLTQSSVFLSNANITTVLQDYNWASQVAQWLTIFLQCSRWILSLGQEDPLEKEMATHSSILPWKMPWTEKPGGSCPWSHTVRNNRAHTHTDTHTHTLNFMLDSYVPILNLSVQWNKHHAHWKMSNPRFWHAGDQNQDSHQANNWFMNK